MPTMPYSGYYAIPCLVIIPALCHIMTTLPLCHTMPHSANYCLLCLLCIQCFICLLCLQCLLCHALAIMPTIPSIPCYADNGYHAKLCLIYLLWHTVATVPFYATMCIMPTNLLCPVKSISNDLLRN